MLDKFIFDAERKLSQSSNTANPLLSTKNDEVLWQ